MTAYTFEPGIWLDDRLLTTPVGAKIQKALDKWMEQHTDEIAVVLEPFGLHPYDLATPEYRRVVTVGMLRASTRQRIDGDFEVIP